MRTIDIIIVRLLIHIIVHKVKVKVKLCPPGRSMVLFDDVVRMQFRRAATLACLQSSLPTTTVARFLLLRSKAS